MMKLKKQPMGRANFEMAREVPTEFNDGKTVENKVDTHSMSGDKNIIATRADLEHGVLNVLLLLAFQFQ